MMAPQMSTLAVIKMADHIHCKVHSRKKGSNTNYFQQVKRKHGGDTNTKHSPLPCGHMLQH